jgi:hypothetical protein
MSLDSMRESVGIREVRHDGVKLEAAMALDIVGGALSTVTAADGVKTYLLDLEARERWDMPAVFVAAGGSESLALAIGSMHALNLENYGVGDVLTAALPLVVAADVGRRVGVTCGSGASLGIPGSPELHVVTSGGQVIDVGRVPPYSFGGSRPRAVFVAAEMSPGVYGWITECYSAGP